MLELCVWNLQGDVFDMLNSFSDFSEFKNLMLSYKAVETGTSRMEGIGPIVTNLGDMDEPNFSLGK